MILTSMLYFISELEGNLVIIQLPNFIDEGNEFQRREITRM